MELVTERLLHEERNIKDRGGAGAKSGEAMNDLESKDQDVISVTSLVTSSGTVLNVNELK